MKDNIIKKKNKKHRNMSFNHEYMASIIHEDL